MSSDVAPGAFHLDAVTKHYDRRASDQWYRNARPGPDPAPLAGVTAVDRVDLEVRPGERVGLIGDNGAGKSTLLKLIAGVSRPSRGRLAVGGRVGAMIELGVGFHPDLTGRENVRIGAALAGLGPADLDDVFEELAAFAGLGEAIDEPLRHYSTGMRARLGFALATHVPADLLLVDEVLAVGDPDFQARCVARIHELCDGGVTLVFVSHEMWVLDGVCDRVVRLEAGSVVDDGPAPDVIARYLAPVDRAHRRDEDAPLRLRSVTVASDDVAPGEPLELRAELAVAGTVDVADLEVAFVLPTVEPDRPVGVAVQRIPDEVARSGGTLVGVSTPVPVDTGHVRVRTRLLDPRADTVLDEASAEFWVDRASASRRPQLAVRVDWRTMPVADGERPDAVTAAPVGGEVLGRLTGVTKTYRSGRRSSFDRRLLPGRWGADAEGDIVAVDDVDLAFQRGTSTGIIGPNGAGKTTLLRLLAGTIAPTRGKVATSGRVVSMLDLGLGFHPDVSGRENARLTALLLGVPAAGLAERTGAMFEFAGLGDAIEAPVKQYSSGMRARLGLAVALHTDPDLLLVDEALAVGDERFRRQAILAVDELRAQGAAVLFVSHDLQIVREVCDRVVRIERGRATADGPADEVLPAEVDEQRGTSQSLTAVAFGPLTVNRTRIVTGGRLELTGEIDVVEPAPWLRVEVRYSTRYEVRPPPGSEDERLAVIFTRVVEPAGGPLATPGRRRYDVVIDRNHIAGDVLVAVTAVDERDERDVAEAWHAVTFGNPRPGELTPVWCPMEVRWSPAG
jgi:ABC-type polysaccharide/polyol phosphate transport system ATPase subunit